MNEGSQQAQSGMVQFIQIQGPRGHACFLGHLGRGTPQLELAVGNVVVDSEEITRNFPEGLGTIEMLCIYEVVSVRIARALFALGGKGVSSVPNDAA